MTTQVGIVNRALNYLAAKTISSMAEAVEQAVRANLIYDDVRDAVLRDHEWGFATKIEQLTLFDDNTIPGWEYLYTYPASCLKIRRIYIDGESSKPDAIEYREMLTTDAEDAIKKVVACNYNPVYSEYTYKITDTTVYDPKFVEALALKLASELSKSLTGNIDNSIKFLQLYQVAISDAKRLNKEESNYTIKSESTYLEARE